MRSVVFISDLHLHPDEPLITERFKRFLAWALDHAQTIYILGDFFHVWPGDDAIDSWSESLIAELVKLHHQGIKIYFMPGNRDFLLGRKFYRHAKIKYLPDPSVIYLQGKPVILSHGDRYCWEDKPHQRFRFLTRNAFFRRIFLALPLFLRRKLVNSVRYHSENKEADSRPVQPITFKALLKDMNLFHADTIIHGHIHQLGHVQHEEQSKTYHQYVLSDWDLSIHVLCYNKSMGFYFDGLEE